MLPAEIELLPEERDRLLAAAAAAVRAKRMEHVAILFLEMHRPLGFLSSQALVVFTPFIAPIAGLDRCQEVSALLADPANVDRLINLLCPPEQAEASRS